jgi:hypothetical protein
MTEQLMVMILKIIISWFVMMMMVIVVMNVRQEAMTVPMMA